MIVVKDNLNRKQSLLLHENSGNGACEKGVFPLCSAGLTRLRQLRRVQQVGDLVALALKFSSNNCMCWLG
jgi:hypothetical protein